MVTVDSDVVAVVEVVMRDRFGLVVIDGNAVTDRIEVVIGTAAHFATLDEALYKELFVHQQVDHDCFKKDTAAATTSGFVFIGISTVVDDVLMTMLCVVGSQIYPVGGVYCTSSG